MVRKYRSKKGSLRKDFAKAKRGKKASATVRQTEANRRAIKELKGDQETKFAQLYNASIDTNYCGYTLLRTPIDNMGYPQTSKDYVTLATGTGGQYLPDKQYQPVWVCPQVLQQGVTQSTRVGNEVTMKSLVIKGQVVGGEASLNGGDFANLTMKQTMHMYVILDTAPQPENTTLALTPSTFQTQAIAGQNFNFPSNWNPLIPAGTSLAQNRGLADNLKSVLLVTANPPGPNTGSLAQKSLLALSFWSTDNDGISKGDRFKLLLHKKYSVNQLPPANAQTNAFHIENTKSFTEYIKAPYKFKYATDKNMLPDNQRIYICFISETPTCRNSGANPPLNYVMPPTVTMISKLNFIDS